MQISFGKKIPIAQCQVFDKEQNKLVQATVNEYDCTTLSDFSEVQKLASTWKYADIIARGIYAKNHCYYTKTPTSYHFFNIEKENGEVLGIAHCDEKQSSLDVNFIETKQDKRHKYVGQTFLSTLAAHSINIGKLKLRIKNAVETAEGFYENICGFKRNFEDDFEISQKEIPQFINQTESRTSSKIIDIKG